MGGGLRIFLDGAGNCWWRLRGSGVSYIWFEEAGAIILMSGILRYLGRIGSWEAKQLLYLK
jgi:hypothetical protein